MLKKSLVTALCVCFVSQAAVLAEESVSESVPVQKVRVEANAPAQKLVMLQTGTRIPFTIHSSVNSDNLKNGDMISITIGKDVFVDGAKVFKKGAEGVLFVTESKRSGGHGKGGKLEITGGKFNDAFGNEHAFNLSISRQGESKRGSAITASVLGVALILVPFGIWMHGKPATLEGGTAFEGLTTSAAEIAVAI